MARAQRFAGLRRSATRRAFTALCLCCVVLPGRPAIADELQPLRSGIGAEDNLHVVVVSEGFTAAENAAFFAAAAKLIDGVVAADPFAFFAPWWHVDALFVASAQGGADHPGSNYWVDTTFDARFGSGGIARLLTVANGKVIAAVAKNAPTFDLIIVLVNDATYGGSGGPVSVVSRHPLAIDILRHELGHTFGGLADEYEDANPSYPVGDDEPNVATAAHLDPLGWAAWVEATTPIPTPITLAQDASHPIGAYEGARYHSQGFFRPAPSCIMRSLSSPWCAVCSEAMVAAMADRALRIRSVSPPPSAKVSCVTGHCPTFTVESTPHPALAIDWAIDGAWRAGGPSFQPLDPTNGATELRATVKLVTPLLSDVVVAALALHVAWQLEVLASAGADAGGGADGSGADGGGIATDAGADVDTSGSKHVGDVGGSSGCGAGTKRQSHELPIWVLGLVSAALLFTRRRRWTERRRPFQQPI
jgi:MYXO-CTERM domain-containing protein